MIMVAFIAVLFPSLIYVGQDLNNKCSNSYTKFCNARMGRAIDATETDDLQVIQKSNKPEYAYVFWDNKVNGCRELTGYSDEITIDDLEDSFLDLENKTVIKEC